MSDLTDRLRAEATMIRRFWAPDDAEDTLRPMNLARADMMASAADEIDRLTAEATLLSGRVDELRALLLRCVPMLKQLLGYERSHGWAANASAVDELVADIEQALAREEQK